MSTQAITKEIKLSKNSKKQFINAMESKSSSINLGKKIDVRVK